jgi:hypothetical protein
MSENKWYFSLWVLVIAVFLLGPMAIPLVWMNPRLSKGVKIAVIIFIMIMFVWFLYLSAEIVKAVIKEVAELERVMK